VDGRSLGSLNENGKYLRPNGNVSLFSLAACNEVDSRNIAVLFAPNLLINVLPFPVAN
jgi:hypothetical protein